MPTPSSFLDHARPDDLEGQVSLARTAMETAWLRSVEIMFLELRAVLDEEPRIVALSYDQEGDVDNMPLFSCLDADGNDLADEIEAAEALAEAWNGRLGAPVEGFLGALEGHVFHRNSFERDVEAACGRMMEQNILRDGPDIRAWSASFASHLQGLALDSEASPADASRGRKHPQRRI